MPRIKKVKNYTHEQLTNIAKDVINKKTSDRKAGKEFSIGRQIIRDRVNELLGNRQLRGVQGRKPMLGHNEDDFTKVIKDMADAGFAPTAKQVLSLATEFAEVNEIANPFFNPEMRISPSKKKVNRRIWLPTRKWLYSFIKRNNLSKKKTKGMHIGRFRNIRNPFLINGFYDMLETQLKRLDLMDRPECVWNLDESGFPMDPNNIETISVRGQKVVKVVAGTGRENITALAACNAAGKALPPLIVYSSQAAILNSIPPEWAGDKDLPLLGIWYGLSKSGWMTTTVFEGWFKEFINITKPNRPLLLLLDGHISHLSSETRRKAVEENITILKLPSHTTSKLQPLDISVFGPLKSYWMDQMNNWIISTGIPIKAMSKKQFVNNLSAIWFKGLSPQNIKSGFATTGIFPFNRQKYDQSIFDPDLVKKYKRWVEMGKPEEMDEALEDANVSNITEPENDAANNQPEHLFPPPLDELGNKRKGKWVWIDENESNPTTPNPSEKSSKSFLEVVTNRFAHSTPVLKTKRQKRIDMNATVITQSSIEEAINEPGPSKINPKKKATKKILHKDSSEKDSTSEDSTTEEEIDTDIEKLYDEMAEEESDEKEYPQYSQMLSSCVQRVNKIKESFEAENWTVEVKGKLYAVHYDEPRKFYIGHLDSLFCSDEDKKVNEATFKFLEYRGNWRFNRKLNARLETVPSRNIFYGPIKSSLSSGNTIAIEQAIHKDITNAWKEFCEENNF